MAIRSLSEPPALIESRASEADMPPTLTALGDGGGAAPAGFSEATAMGAAFGEREEAATATGAAIGAGSSSDGAGGETFFASSLTTSFGGARSAAAVDAVVVAAAAAAIGVSVGREAATATGDMTSGSELTGIEPDRFGSDVGGIAMGAAEEASSLA